MRTLSIKSKAALVTTAGVLLLFAAFAALEIHRVRTEMQAVLGTQQLTLISRIADELDDKITSAHRVLIITAEATPPEMVADLAAMERSMWDQPGYRSLFDDVFLIGRDGRGLIDLPVLNRRGIDVHDRDYFRRTIDTRKPVISGPYMGRGLNEPVVMMTAPILDRTGEVVGILAGAIHPLKPNFLGKLREARVGATGRFILVSRDRTIIVSQDANRIMTKGPEPGVAPFFDHAVAGREGWEESTNSRGVGALYSYKPLASVPWVLVAALPVEEAYAPIAAAQTQAIGIAVLLALLLAPLVWFGMQYVLAPIGVLRDIIRRIRGDPESEALVHMPRHDELGDLAEDFNALTREHRRAHQALSEHADMLQGLSRRLMEVEENERRKINRELHDRIGQNLAALSINLNLIRSGLTPQLLPAVGARVSAAQAMLEETVVQIRDVMSDLHPPALDDYGLLAALRGYGQSLNAVGGVPIAVRGDDLAPRLPLAIETTLFRIAQGAITNAIAHARAQHIEVALAATRDRVTLTIADDGTGFDPEHGLLARPHWGLSIMRERATAAGAVLQVDSAPGRGTRIVVEIARGRA